MDKPTRAQVLAAIGSTYEAQYHLEQAVAALGDTEDHDPAADLAPLTELRGATRVVGDVVTTLHTKITRERGGGDAQAEE